MPWIGLEGPVSLLVELSHTLEVVDEEVVVVLMKVFRPRTQRFGLNQVWLKWEKIIRHLEFLRLSLSCL